MTLLESSIIRHLDSSCAISSISLNNSLKVWNTFIIVVFFIVISKVPIFCSITMGNWRSPTLDSLDFIQRLVRSNWIILTASSLFGIVPPRFFSGPLPMVLQLIFGALPVCSLNFSQDSLFLQVKLRSINWIPSTMSWVPLVRKSGPVWKRCHGMDYWEHLRGADLSSKKDIQSMYRVYKCVLANNL